MDLVLITTIIFYLGMVIIGPAAQGIIHTRTYDICEEGNSTEVYPADISSEDLSTYDQSTKDPRSIKGVDDYTIVQYGFRQFLNLRPLQIMSPCPKSTINCTYVNITLPRITTDCTMGSIDTTRILDIYHSNLTNTRDYFTNYSPSIPAYFYSGSMVNRTYYDLNNLTLPYVLADKPPFNAEARRMIGDQKFVAVSSGNTMGRDWNSNFDKLQVRECTLRSTYDRTQLVDTQGEINITVLSSESVDMDYDNIIGNNVFLSQYGGDNKKTNVMLNSYALQISFMRSLIINEQNVMLSMAGWSFDNVLQGLGTQVGYTYSITGPKQMFLGLPARVTICRRTDVLFALDKGSYLPLALCLVIPLIWWVTQWVLSLYKVNGVSRGHSQVSLLVSGLTPAAHEKMRGTIHEDQYATMAAASKINVKFGERISDGHPTFGLAEEVNPIGIRRMSF
ncbi:hypothetical protein BJV82DRAFT_24900 [Fennellomyces sp. T-0311]|nr:hypothetical protein BJV82DRAFT_24900 [Fennellomyces sp. T-0311]